jgi:DNA-binding NarL/FixJ family response regulator
MRQLVRVLLVDDYAPIRDYVRSVLRRRPDLHVIGEASDGVLAVRAVLEFEPDLILLDIGLPHLNGIEVARRVREVLPLCKIILLTEIRSWSFVEDALHCGAAGYVVKSDAGRELLQAIDAVLQGIQFVSSSIEDGRSSEVLASQRHHEAGFFTDEQQLLDHVSDFLTFTLKAGNSAIVVAPDTQRSGILKRLTASGRDMAAFIGQGRYTAVDVHEALAKFMVKGKPDSHRFLTAFNGLVDRAAHASRGGQGRVCIYGVCTQILYTEGNSAAAVQTELLVNQLFDRYNLHVLCGYAFGGLQEIKNSHIFQQIRDAHSAVHFH